MPEENIPASVPFDIERLKELIQLMEEHDLTEVDLHKGDQRCRLRRGSQQMVPAAYAPAPYPVMPQQPSAPAGGAAEGAAPKSDGTLVIKSPTVGTFYSAASPDDEPFVKIGSPVSPDTVVCLVEAMKVYNQITADVSGTVTEVCVHNGDAVEFGQPLFRVRPG
jgi:acetyl-CoA carboxylase biotin carboxyl carrier protein